MGSLCDKTQSTTIDEPKSQEKNIPLPSYSSNVDEAVANVEGKYM